MLKVRGKFRVTEITRNYWNADAAQVKLEAVYTNSPEDNTYSAATPSGKIEMSITNPSAIEHFAIGKSLYVDFTLAE